MVTVNRNWTTENEKEWLDNLGTHRRNGLPKKNLLKNIWRQTRKEPTGGALTKKKFWLMPKNY